MLSLAESVTVTLQVSVLPSLSFAVMVHLPALWAVTLPSFTEATVGTLEDQVTLRPPRFLTFSVALLPTFSVRLVLLSLAESVTVTLQVSVLPSLSFAVMVHVPALWAVTLPPCTVATVGTLEDQVTVRPPRLLTCSVALPPTCRLRLVLLSLAGSVTVTPHFKTVPSLSVAVITHLPARTAVTLPWLTVAMPGLSDDQLTVRPDRFSTVSVALSPTFRSRAVFERLAGG